MEFAYSVLKSLFLCTKIFHALRINFASFNPSCTYNAHMFLFRASNVMNIEQRLPEFEKVIDACGTLVNLR